MNTTLNEYLNQGNLWGSILSLAPEPIKSIATADRLKSNSLFMYGSRLMFDRVYLLSDDDLASSILLTYQDKWLSLISAELNSLDLTMDSGRKVTETIIHDVIKTGSVDHENKVSAFNSDTLVVSDGTHDGSTDTDNGTKTRTLSDGNISLNNLLNNLSLIQQTNIINVVTNDVISHITLTVY